MAALRLMDYRDFVAYLGHHETPFGRKVVEVAWVMPLPEGWTEQCSEGRLFFFNGLTDKATWKHPLEQTFRDVIAEVESWEEKAKDFETACTLAATYLEDISAIACEDLRDWRGPFYPHDLDDQANSRPYYYSVTTGESSWESPLSFWDADLKFRAEALEQCLNLFMGDPKPFSDNINKLLDNFASLRLPDIQGLNRMVQAVAPEVGEGPVEFMSARSELTKADKNSEFCSARSALLESPQNSSRPGHLNVGTLDSTCTPVPETSSGSVSCSLQDISSSRRAADDEKDSDTHVFMVEPESEDETELEKS